MSSKQLVFVVIVVIFSGCSLEESAINQTLIAKLCNHSSLAIDSMVGIYGTDFVFLIAEDLVFKLEIKIDGQSVIKSAQRLEDWSPEIRTPIDWMYSTRKDTKHISLINCRLRKEWIIRYEDNYYEGSVDSEECQFIIEYVVDPQTGLQYYLEDSFIPDDKLVIYNPFYYQSWVIVSENKDLKAIRAVATRQGEPFFKKLNGNPIKAAFIHSQHWFLFGGRYYCRVSLKQFEDCIPTPLNDWISNCAPQLLDPKQSNATKNKDISLYVFIVMAIIIVAVVVIVIIVVLITKEYKKRGTYINQSSGSSIQS